MRAGSMNPTAPHNFADTLHIANIYKRILNHFLSIYLSIYLCIYIYIFYSNITNNSLYICLYIYIHCILIHAIYIVVCYYESWIIKLFVYILCHVYWHYDYYHYFPFLINDCYYHSLFIIDIIVVMFKLSWRWLLFLFPFIVMMFVINIIITICIMMVIIIIIVNNHHLIIIIMIITTEMIITIVTMTSVLSTIKGHVISTLWLLKT